MSGRSCMHKCGFSAFGRFPTCCTWCRGPTGPHARDCRFKNRVIQLNTATPTSRPKSRFMTVPKLPIKPCTSPACLQSENISTTSASTIAAPHVAGSVSPTDVPAASSPRLACQPAKRQRLILPTSATCRSIVGDDLQIKPVKKRDKKALNRRIITM